MKIAIVGVGGVGGYIGSKMCGMGNYITFVARGEHKKVIDKYGLKVIDNNKSYISFPDKIVEKLDEVYDLIFITTKCYDFANLEQIVSDGIDKNTVIIVLSNGVENDQKLNKIINQGIICNGCIYIISNIKEYGVIEKIADTFYLIFGHKNEIYSEKLKEIESFLVTCGLKSKYSQNIEKESWKKYLFIASFATLTSYYEKSIGYVVTEKRDKLILLLNEIKDVANKKGVDLDQKDIDSVMLQAQKVPYHSKTSMQLDFEKHRVCEIESLSGFIVKEGNRLNVDVFLMEKIYKNLICKIECSNIEE